MNSSSLPDHAWNTPVEETTGTTPQENPTSPAHGTDASAGFQVLSLEQYAASHARSMHQPHDR